MNTDTYNGHGQTHGHGYGPPTWTRTTDTDQRHGHEPSTRKRTQTTDHRHGHEPRTRTRTRTRPRTQTRTTDTDTNNRHRRRPSTRTTDTDTDHRHGHEPGTRTRTRTTDTVTDYRHAPTRITKRRHQPLTPWLDTECRASRRKSRMFERRYKRTRLPADWLAWTTQVRAMHEIYRQRQNLYWRSKVKESSGSPTKLWKVLNSILCKKKETLTIPSSNRINAESVSVGLSQTKLLECALLHLMHTVRRLMIVDAQ